MNRLSMSRYPFNGFRCDRQADAASLCSEREHVILLRLPARIPRRSRCPVAFYSDKHTVFRINRDAKGGAGMTQFGRAIAELNIEIICANSSQAKAAWSA